MILGKESYHLKQQILKPKQCVNFFLEDSASIGHCVIIPIQIWTARIILIMENATTVTVLTDIEMSANSTIVEKAVTESPAVLIYTEITKLPTTMMIKELQMKKK